MSMPPNTWLLERLAALEQRVSQLEKRLLQPATMPQRSTRMTEEWQPRTETEAWAREKFPHVDETREREKFRDYWQSRGDVRRDWDAAYRNWIRKEDEYQAARPSGGGRRPATRGTAIAETNRQRIDSFADQLAARWRGSAGGDGPGGD